MPESTPRWEHHRTWWVWWVCTLLLLATMINYLDRQALTVTAARIKAEFSLSNEQYGRLEMSFGLAFAVGQTLLGICADRVSVRWFYPLLLALWSLMGFLTGWADTFLALLVCRTLLGFFEGGNWPCGLTVIQRILPPSDRALGNGLLQGGGAIGAVLTPLIMVAFLTDAVGSWRPAFQVIGAAGAVWIVLWLASVRGQSFAASTQLSAARRSRTECGTTLRVVNCDAERRTTIFAAATHGDDSFAAVLCSRRFLVVLCVGMCCNICWHMVRVWMPLYLQEGRGFDERAMLAVNAGYFIAADLGCWLAGGTTMWLARRGVRLPVARRCVYLACCLLTSLSVLTFVVPSRGVIVILMLVGAGCLGMFPAFYALSQELSERHQGKTIGVLGTAAWLVLAVLHPLFGRWVDQSKSYDLGIALVGLVPLISCAVLWLGWPVINKNVARPM